MKQPTTLIPAFLFLILGASHVWALPNCVGPYSATSWDNCVGTKTFTDGNKYVGDWQNGKLNGQGVYTFGNVQKYLC